MKTIEWRFLDRSGWDNGPWGGEPDKKQFSDPTTGLPCLARRSILGNWCGYVGVPSGHRFYGCDYDALDPRIHGGVNFAGPCDLDDPDHGICHKPDASESDDVWWFGFDCGHAYDLIPAIRVEYPTLPYGQYRSLDYVECECAKLAAYLSETPK